MNVIIKLSRYSLKKTMFTLTVYEILLSEARSVLRPAVQVTGTETVKFYIRFEIYLLQVLQVL